MQNHERWRDGLTMNDSGAIIRYNGKRYEF